MSFTEELRRELEEKLRSVDKTPVKIALLGQPGAGKSSVINSLIGERLFETGVHTDTTTESKEVKWGSLVITDLPGYGTKAFPIDDWKKKFSVDQYDLYLFVFSGKLSESDGKLFQYLDELGEQRVHPYFIVRNKLDDIWDDVKPLEQLKKEIECDVKSKMGKEEDVDVFFTSCRTKEGFNELKTAIFDSNLSKVQKSKLIFDFKAATEADLDRKKEAAMEHVDLSAFASAVNGLNPIPGVDISVDLGIFWQLMSEIRKIFDLDDEEKLNKYLQILGPAAKKLVDEVLAYFTKDGIIVVLKQLGMKYARQKASKYIPGVGMVMSSVLGYYMTKELGGGYVDVCYELSRQILEKTVSDSK